MGHYSTLTRQSGPTIAVTRLCFRHTWLLIPAVIMFRRLYAAAQRDPAFLRGQVGVADPWTLVNISLWRSRWAMLQWSGHPDHVDAVRWTYTRTTEVWSADWDLNQVSASACQWHGRFALDESSTRSGEQVPAPLSAARDGDPGTTSSSEL